MGTYAEHNDVINASGPPDNTGAIQSGLEGATNPFVGCGTKRPPFTRVSDMLHGYDALGYLDNDYAAIRTSSQLSVLS